MSSSNPNPSPLAPNPLPNPNPLKTVPPNMTSPQAQSPPPPATNPTEPVPYYALRAWLAQPVIASFIAGGTAGAVSRTVVSPLERLKILLQVQNVGRNEYKMSIGKALSKMWREEGWRGMMAGNGTNCIRIVPYSAVQFGSYNIYKKVCCVFLSSFSLFLWCHGGSGQQRARGNWRQATVGKERAVGLRIVGVERYSTSGNQIDINISNAPRKTSYRLRSQKSD